MFLESFWCVRLLVLTIEINWFYYPDIFCLLYVVGCGFGLNFYVVLLTLFMFIKKLFRVFLLGCFWFVPFFAMVTGIVLWLTVMVIAVGMVYHSRCYPYFLFHFPLCFPSISDDLCVVYSYDC